MKDCDVNVLIYLLVYIKCLCVSVLYSVRSTSVFLSFTEAGRRSGFMVLTEVVQAKKFDHF